MFEGQARIALYSGGAVGEVIVVVQLLSPVQHLAPVDCRPPGRPVPH